MTVELIYHSADSVAGGVSPFDEVVRRITQKEDVRLACPYLSVRYLDRIVESCSSLRVLTDVEEWLASCNSDGRQRITSFVVKHSERVHHYKDLHAKVLVAGESALVGSANFTEKGITKRIEVSVLIVREKQVEELQRWFDALWLQTAPVDVTEMQAYADALPDVRVEQPRISITSKAPRVKARVSGDWLKPVEAYSDEEVEQLSDEELAQVMDEEFWKSLLKYKEIGPEVCKKKGCTRSRIRYSVMCRQHHFEMITKRPVPRIAG